MWERKAEEASFNGIAFNILNTSLDNGKRVQVVEMPYRDDPFVRVMGAKAKGISLEVVFVGVNSLEDSNALVNKLEASPIGTLIHPYLGELSLVFETASQSFSTKKGLVSVSLKFLKQGKPLSISHTNISEKSTAELVDDVREESKAQFTEEIETAHHDDVASFIDDVKDALSTVQSIANKISSKVEEASQELTRLNNQIQDTINAVNTVINAPGAFFDHLSATFNKLSNMLEKLTGKNEEKESSVIPALIELQQSINKKPNGNAHCKIQITLAMVLISKEIATLEEYEFVSTSDLVGDDKRIETKNNDVDTIRLNIRKVRREVELRYNDSTITAKYQGMPLSNALEALNKHISLQESKVTNLLNNLKIKTVFTNTPALCLAKSEESTYQKIMAVNPQIEHPLFCSGEIRYGE